MSLIPRWHNRLPSLFGKASNLFNLGQLLEDEFGSNTGISVSSDDKYVYVEADVPGLTAKDIDVTIDDQGVLWIKGERKEEEKDKKFYKKTHHSFSYYVTLGDEIDTLKPPKAVTKNGIMKITFEKRKGSEKKNEKKIPVEESEE